MLCLSCPKYECLVITKGRTINIDESNYEPGKIKCNLCGGPLTTIQEDSIDHQLIAMGIKKI